MTLPPGAQDALLAYAELLADRGAALGLSGRGGLDEVLVLDILDALSIVPLLPSAGSLVDVGTGAGVPGVPIALATGLEVTLLDSKGRAAAFLEEALALTGAPAQVEIVRAEDAGRGGLRERFDVAVARAVAPLPVLCELLLPLVRVGGAFVAMKGPRAGAEAEAAVRACALLGGGSPRVVPLRVPFLDAARAAVVVEKERPTPEGYPRRAGVPERRPLS